jgi:hypothetical protein
MVTDDTRNRNDSKGMKKGVVRKGRITMKLMKVMAAHIFNAEIANGVASSLCVL